MGIGRKCVYAHLVGDRIVYVGKGLAQRPYEVRYRPQRWKEAVENKGFTVQILGWFDSDSEALAFEKQKIKEFNPIGNTQSAPHIREARRKAFPKWGGVRIGSGRPTFCKCLWCDYEWYKRTLDQRPKACPECKRRDWDRGDV